MTFWFKDSCSLKCCESLLRIEFREGEVLFAEDSSVEEFEE